VGSNPIKGENKNKKVYSLIGKTSVCGIEDIGSIPIRPVLIIIKRGCGVMVT
jgi:hypothetical protein